MDFRDKLLSSEVRHVTELVNMLSYELVILQDFLTEEFGRKYKRFRSTHVFGSESTQDLSQPRGGVSTSIRSIGGSKHVENTKHHREFRSENINSQSSQQDLLGENKSSRIVILQNPDTNPASSNLEDESGEGPPSASAPERSNAPIIMDTDDGVEEQYETKLIPETAFNPCNKNSTFDDEMDSDSESSSEEEFPSSSWTKQDELEARRGPYCKSVWDYFEWKKLPDGRKIVRCPKCKVNVSAVAKRMRRHRERCTGEGRLSFAGMKREDITATASSMNTGESSSQSAPTQPIDTTPRTVGKPKGLVWSHFEKICTPDSQVIVKCNYCRRKVSNHATRMARHLQNCEQSPVKDPQNIIDDSLGVDHLM
ncbi:unnamed protein product [Orchesella dallaii]|uniref:BED-type domain-containing protein n=1 Tax=Orchesella dallaii TaxID=48710 RepID=A0ABP1QTR6_9HEXA